MKKFAVILLLLTTPLLCFGRLMKAWTYQELFDQADLVVVAVPISTHDTKESGGLPGWSTIETVGVNTEFQSSVVMKGDTKVKKFILHHYRLKNPKQIPPNAPSFVGFKPPFKLETSERFLLFLKRESDGKYAPVSGQIDPALFDVVKLNGMAR